MPVFTRSSFHLEWTHLPYFSSFVLKHGPLGDTCGPVCLTVVSLEMGNGIKKPKKEQRHWTANYQQEGWGVEESGGGGGGGERFLIRPPCAPLTPSSPFSCSSILYAHCCLSPSSVAIYLLLRVLSSSKLWRFCSVPLRRDHSPSEITPGRCCRWGLGWRFPRFGSHSGSWILCNLIRVWFFVVVKFGICCELLTHDLQLVVVIRRLKKKNGTFKLDLVVSNTDSDFLNYSALIPDPVFQVTG